MACAEDTPIVSVSLTELLVQPEEYSGRRIAVVGFLDEHAGVLLFLSEDHSLSRDFESAIIVSDTIDLEISKSSCIGKYVRVIGTFRSFEYGDYLVADVERIVEPSTVSRCWAVDTNDRSWPLAAGHHLPKADT